MEDAVFEKREAVRQMMSKLSFEGVPNVDAKEAAQMPRTLFVDVRADDEFNVSAIPNAVHFRKFEELVRDNAVEEENICFYCTVGYRSGKYASKLVRDRPEGLEGKRLYNLNGSILDWTHEPSCGPLRKPDGDSGIARGDIADSVHCFGERWDLASDKYTSVVFNKAQQTFEGVKWVFF